MLKDGALDYEPEQHLSDVIGEQVDDELTDDIDFESLDASVEETEVVA